MSNTVQAVLACTAEPSSLARARAVRRRRALTGTPADMEVIV